MLDLSPLRIPAFLATVTGGTVFRVTIGTVPFLLPLLFQIGFGLDAFRSGMLVLATFLGNIGMKPFTTCDHAPLGLPQHGRRRRRAGQRLRWGCAPCCTPPPRCRC